MAQALWTVTSRCLSDDWAITQYYLPGAWRAAIHWQIVCDRFMV
ncbi:hypothetical protein BSU04_03825 [Caballeronia sordidicola]|uniref:Uncharacterized protein n=1 Tax=Caballeronia sordidicola TaxID=196367 RepID=A0A226X9B7_CABSO|nr:hypothetical protein BSU04_03825 [Caballeronia sordidicola]